MKVKRSAKLIARFKKLRRAAIDDGKNIHDHPAAGVPGDYRGRLHQAADLLRKVRTDTYREEDNPSVRGLRDRALGHVDAALHAITGTRNS